MIDFYQSLKTLATELGIESEYSNNWGEIRLTEPNAAAEILAAKGMRIAPEVLDLTSQVMVVFSDELPAELEIYLSNRIDIKNIKGEPPLIEAVLISADGAQSIPDTSAAVIRDDEKTGLQKIAVPFPRDIDAGIHRLKMKATFQGAATECVCTLAICPPKAYVPAEIEQGRKVAGICLALYGVRSETNWGIGDFADLKKIIDWAANILGVDFIGLNPLHALFNKRPYNHSPYNPSSRFFGNHVYLDITSIDEFLQYSELQGRFSSDSIQIKLRHLREEEQVNYEEVSSLKLTFLREIFNRFYADNAGAAKSAGWNEFKKYVEREGTCLERFATFCALEDHFKNVMPDASCWGEWPESFQDPQSMEIEEFRKLNKKEVLFWMYVQWQFFMQLGDVREYAENRGMLVGLYNDDALAVDANGADCWAWQDYFHRGFRVGAPPDAFAPDGQDWGFPPPNNDRARREGYDLFAKRLESACRLAGALRIDHVMQFHHLFWIPATGKPENGVYVKNREHELIGLVTLQSVRNKTLIIGEDLGTLPFGFRDRLMGRKIFSYRVFYFERDDQENQIPYYQYPQCALVTISTHDLPTLKGFWTQRDIDERVKIGQLDKDREKEFREARHRHKAKIIERLVNDGCLPAERAHQAWISPVPNSDLHEAVLRFVLNTPSSMAAINQEDLFLDARQQNLPGTTWERPNWVTKMMFSVEELMSDPEALRIAKTFRKILEESGRTKIL